ncbi:MAG TPA: hypothetical protein VF875_03970 [Anaeromyxobacter sp.]
MVGQHIRAMKGGRWIHAIDCGDETVLHLADEATPQRVRRAYRPEFVAGSATVEVITHRERTFPAKEIVRRAYSRASDPTLAAMFLDSEAFAEWCATGRLAGARNVALEIPGLLPAAAQAAPAKPAPAKAALAKAAPAKPGPRKASPAPKKAAAKRAAPARKAKAKAAAKHTPKKAAKAKAGRAKPPRKAKPAARRGAKPARKKSRR